jgi:uncharacterized protein
MRQLDSPAPRMQRLIVDTGPLIGWFDTRDEYHGLARQRLTGYRGELLSTWPVLSEVCAMLPERLVGSFLRWVGAGGVTVVDLPSSALPGLADRIDQYADLPMDFADASLIWLAEHLGILDLLTVDRKDVGVYCTARGQALRNRFFEDAASVARPSKSNRRSG